jgi:hypothetical protein
VLCAAASFRRIKSKDPEEELLESISQSGEKGGKRGDLILPTGVPFLMGSWLGGWMYLQNNKKQNPTQKLSNSICLKLNIIFDFFLFYSSIFWLLFFFSFVRSFVDVTSHVAGEHKRVCYFVVLLF